MVISIELADTWVFLRADRRDLPAGHVDIVIQYEIGGGDAALVIGIAILVIWVDAIGVLIEITDVL